MEKEDMMRWRQEISYCFQQPVLFDATVRDNLDFPFEIRKTAKDETREKEMLRSVNLPEQFLDKPVSELSGGEKQRVALLRNLMFPPGLLLLDEVMTGLDRENEEIVENLVQMYIKEGGTIIRVTHNNEETICTRKIHFPALRKECADEKHGC